MATNWLSQLATFSEEAADRCSVAKIDFLTGVGKSMLPKGFWGGHCDVDEPEPNSLAPGADPPVYLTFDDGPDPDTTPRLLELLAESSVKAMFFLIGQKVERHPDLVERIRADGHTLANHSYSHPFLLALPTPVLEREIARTNQSIKDITGEDPLFFRAPYGFMDQRAGDCLKERNMKVVYWGAAPEDWSAPGTHRVVRRVLWKLNPGTVVVLHEGYGLGEQTIAAAKQIICTANERGLRMAQVK
jgi:peptidoglycan/xylan/chitin deacetylase (PgdA/CDA1 family)